MASVRFSFLLSLFFSCVVNAELYKWVGPDGKINYSDRPPPKSVDNVQTRSMSAADRNAVLPYELAQALKNMPVTLYSADKCAACLEGRNFLKQHGIPFTEKTVSTEDNDKLIQISGSAQIPVLFIGKDKLLGFSSIAWRSNLTQAGYPEANLLPANYQFAAPQPLTPVVMAPKSIEANNEEKNSVKPGRSVLPAHDPNGFRF